MNFMKDPRTIVIAEVKTKSPFGFVSEKSWDELFAIAERTGDMISVHTDPRWGGSFDLIKKARSLTSKPILAKGIHANDITLDLAFKAGADLVLVVGRVPSEYLADHPDKTPCCLIEPPTIQELRAIPPHMKAVWNSRDLSTGGLKKESFAEAREAFSGWLCQASHIKTVADIEQGADAVLVGEHLEEFSESSLGGAI